jgi:vacuolar iron transporter family protein
MAAGEYMATKTQEEVYQGEAGIERSHIAHHRAQELGELRECFKTIGIVSTSESEAEEVEDLSQRLLAFYDKHDNAHLLAHMVLEFGISDEAKRNPLIAASVSFVLFVCGALPSVLPYAFIEDITVALILAGCLTFTGLFTVGAIKTWATRGNLWIAALENLTVSAGGGVVAYGIGLAFEQLVRGGGGGET